MVVLRIELDSSKWLLYLSFLVYTTSGWATPLFMDALRLSSPSGSDASALPNLKPMLCNTGGMALAWFLSTGCNPFSSALVQRLRRLPWSAPLWRRLCTIAAVDFFSGFLLFQGQLSIGSNLYVVLYASCTLWTALLSRWLLRRPLSNSHWVAIVTITLGLAADAYLSHSDKHGGRSNTRTGVALVLLGSLLHSLMFVQAEALSSGLPVVGMVLADPAAAAEKAKKKKTESQLLLDDADAAAPSLPSSSSSSSAAAVSSIDVCGFMGCTEVLVLLFYYASLATISAATAPAATSFSPSSTAAPVVAAARLEFESYLVLAATNALHAAAFFSILDSLGAVASGVLKGVQMLVVFIASDLLFCAADRSECVTAKKSACVAVVFAGLVLYGWSGGTKPHRGSSAAGGGGAEGFCASNKRQDGPAAAVAKSWGGGGGGGGGGRYRFPADAAGASGSAASSSSPTTAAGAGGDRGGSAWP